MAVGPDLINPTYNPSFYKQKNYYSLLLIASLIYTAILNIVRCWTAAECPFPCVPISTSYARLALALGPVSRRTRAASYLGACLPTYGSLAHRPIARSISFIRTPLSKSVTLHSLAIAEIPRPLLGRKQYRNLPDHVDHAHPQRPRATYPVRLEKRGRRVTNAAHQG